MLNSRGVSERLEQEYEAYKRLASDLYTAISSMAQRFELLRGVNLLTASLAGDLVFVVEGYLKLNRGKREIRMYSDGDFIFFPQKWNDEYEIVSDFKSVLEVFDQAVVTAMAMEPPTLWQKLLELREMENRISLQLCGEFAPEIVDVEMVVKNYVNGDVIIEEGRDGAAVYEMISGRADVVIGGVRVGQVGANEIFGELGFLIDDIARAAVVATEPCFVRVLDPHAFMALLESNQPFALGLLRNLARRVNEINRQIVKQQEEEGRKEEEGRRRKEK